MDITFSQWVIDVIGLSSSLLFEFVIVWFVVHLTPDFDEIFYKVVRRIKSRKELKEKLKEEEKDVK